MAAQNQELVRRHAKHRQNSSKTILPQASFTVELLATYFVTDVIPEYCDLVRRSIGSGVVDCAETAVTIEPEGFRLPQDGGN